MIRHALSVLRAVQRAVLGAVLGCLGLTACASTPEPARMTETPSAEQRAELAAAVMTLTGSRNWVFDLGDLYKSGEMRAAPRSSGREGRVMGSPMMLQLEQSGARCELVEPESQTRIALQSVTCQPR